MVDVLGLQPGRDSYEWPAVTGIVAMWVSQRASDPDGWAETALSEWVGECAWSVAHAKAPGPLLKK